MWLSGKYRTPQLLTQFLDTNGDGSGDYNAAQDFSDIGAGLTRFFITPPQAEYYEIKQLKVHVSDAGKFGQSEYGNLGVALTNGIAIEITDDSFNPIWSLTNGTPIKSNDEFLHNFFMLQLQDFEGTNDSLVATYDFFDIHNQALRLERGQRLVVSLHDDFTGLVDHHFAVSGMK